jgi:6-phosphogluconate dehydrogenase
MDGGNSYFADTNRRMDRLNEKGINYLGVGVSGGSEGARRGPSIMPGGNRQAYESVRPILQAVAAKADDGEPCVEFMGKGAAGNYVKMVHNGIEYALMQLIAECYDVLKRVAGLNNNQLHQTFQSWNATDLKSYLIEITAEIFQQSDDLADGMLVDKILDRAQQKGTGKWTSQHAMDLGVPIPTIDSAVTMRGLSSFHLLRQRVNDFFDFEAGTVVPLSNADRATIVEQVRQALLFGYLISYAQGMHLLVEASREMKMEINLEACARIWRSGCIIRAALLEDIRAAFSQDAQLENLLLSSVFKDRLIDSQIACRAVVKAAIDHAVPVMSLGSALNYFNAIRSPRLPLNLVQAQRDFFGSHTYERTDRDGVFHSTWAASHAAVE